MIDSAALFGEIDLGSAPKLSVDTMSSIGSAKTTKTGDISATFDKTFSQSPMSNSFGIFDTKQVVKEIAPRTPIEDVIDIDWANDTQLTNLSNKTGTMVSTVGDKAAAVDKVIIRIGDDVQTSFSNMNNSPFASNAITGTINKTESSSGGIMSSIGSFTSDPSVSSIFPSTTTKGQYSSLQAIFSDGALGQFNSCPDIANALNYAKRLLDPSGLLGYLSSLFGICGALDIKGILRCVSSIQSQISHTQRIGLTNSLINQGSFNSYSDLVDFDNGGSIIDKYETVRRMSNNRGVIYSPETRRPTNTWVNPDLVDTTDSMFGNMGVDKNRIYSVDTMSAYGNRSIMDDMNTPVYSVASVKASNPDTRFSGYVLGDTDKLLRGLPF